jgi:hypothetical protein
VREQRKSVRFELKLPIELVRSGSKPTHVLGETKNVSSGGVLFTTELPVPVGERIEYFITLAQEPHTGLQVRIRCLGKVVRLEQDGDGPGSEEPVRVAATLERYEFVRG